MAASTKATKNSALFKHLLKNLFLLATTMTWRPSRLQRFLVSASVYLGENRILHNNCYDEEEEMSL